MGTNRQTLVMGACMAVMASTASAQSSVVIYGLMDAGIDYNKTGSVHQWRQLSGGLAGSRIGFRGTEDLGDGLAANFVLEMGPNLDDGTLGQGGRIFGREASVGLSSKTLGAISLGRTPMPYYIGSLAVDAFRIGQSGSLLSVTRSTSTSDRFMLPQLGTARGDNSVQYYSPNWNGLQVRVQGALGEGNTTQGRLYGGSVRYTQGPWDVIASGSVQKGANNANGSAKAVQVGGNYDFSWMKLYLGYTRETNDCTTCTGALARIDNASRFGGGDFRMVNVGGRIPVGTAMGIWQVTRLTDRSSYAVAPGNRDAWWLAVGGEYYLSKRTTLWASVGRINNKNGSNYVLSTGPNPRPNNAVGPGNPESNNFGMGITHTF